MPVQLVVRSRATSCSITTMVGCRAQVELEHVRPDRHGVAKCSQACSRAARLRPPRCADHFGRSPARGGPRRRRRRRGRRGDGHVVRRATRFQVVVFVSPVTRSLCERWNFLTAATWRRGTARPRRPRDNRPRRVQAGLEEPARAPLLPRCRLSACCACWRCDQEGRRHGQAASQRDQDRPAGGASTNAAHGVFRGDWWCRRSYGSRNEVDGNAPTGPSRPRR